MGSNESTPPKPRQTNEQRTARKFTTEEVARALANQRKLYESRIEDLIQNTATSSNHSRVSPAVPSSKLPDQKFEPPRPPLPKTTTTAEPSKATCLERQHTPYSYTPSNSIEHVNRNLTSNTKSLYPIIRDINLSEVSGPSRSPDVFKIDNGHRSESAMRFAPTAPPAELLPSARPAEPPSARQAEKWRSGPSTEPLRSAPPVRSISRSRSEDQDITCRTCMNRFGMKIFNCETGHASCDLCMTQGRACGVCARKITQRRNYNLEEHFHERSVPCPNAGEGCRLHFRFNQMENHLKECPFNETRCPLPPNKCQWKGKLSLMAQHFDTFHPTHRKGNVDTEMFLDNIVTDNKTLHLIKLGNYNFVFHSIVADRKICFAVQLMGTKTSAVKWSYEIHVYNKREPRRKYQYVDKCFATSDSIEEMVNACAVIPLQYAMTFINEGALAYKFFIKKVHQQRDRDSSCNRRGRGGRGRGGYRKH